MNKLSPSLIRSLPLVGACLAVTALAGCANNSGGAGGGSGGTSTGGSTQGAGSGGASASGGASSSGGASGSGGGSGSGGASASGGASSSGGSSAPGGSSGSGGASSSGGVMGTGGSSTGGVTGRGGGSNGGTVGTGGTSGATGQGGASSGGSVGAGGSAGRGAGGNGGAPNSCPSATPLTGGTKYCSNSKANISGGYSYELWSSTTGSGCMTVFGVDAAFSATWTNADDFLARVGLAFDETKTPTQLGTLSADFAETKTGGDGLVYVGIYGWTVSPLREYYILEDWGLTKPADTASDGSPRTKVGVITVDGGTYDVWKHTKTNAPAITGDGQTFDQYFSIRQTARQCGHISISEHFSQWTSLGLQLGKLEEAKLLLEAQSSTGTVAFTTAKFTVK